MQSTCDLVQLHLGTVVNLTLTPASQSQYHLAPLKYQFKNGPRSKAKDYLPGLRIATARKRGSGLSQGLADSKDLRRMAPTTTRTTPVRIVSRTTDDGDHMELAQQFKTIKDYTAYVVARIQQANPDMGQTTKSSPMLSDGPVKDTIVATASPSAEPQASEPVIAVTEEPSNIPLGNGVDETEDEPRPRKEKRIKGRRRAANPDIEIEAALRRQAELKTNFRTLARPLKQVLDEMARRTTESLEADGNAHKTAAEHAIVELQLRQALEKRKADVQRQYDLQHEQLRLRHEAEEYNLRQQCKQTFEDAQSRMMDEVAYEMLQIDRQKQLDEGAMDHETDDEDDIILQPHRMSYRFQRGDAIAPKFDSRSRRDLEVDQAHNHYDGRIDMRGMLEGENFTGDQDGFTVMDSTPRQAALAKRQGIDGMNLLVNASQQVESESRKRKRKQPPIVANKDASSLMQLADLAVKTNGFARSDMPPPMTPRRYSHAPYQEDTRSYDSRHGHKRTRSDLELSSPASKRAHLDHMSPANLKKEQSATPGARVQHLGDAVAPMYQPGGYGMPHDASRDQQFFDRPPLYDDRRMSFSGRPNELPPLQSPFGHSTGLAPPFADYGHHRPMMHPPPMPPTAAPVNHFANGNIHRHSFPSAHFQQGQPPISSWTSIASSPLVALPQGDVQQNLPPMYMSRPDYGAVFSQPPPPPLHQHMGGPALQPQPQYGGQMLAPAAGFQRVLQPAFAQQADRHEQTKRRNTESNAEKRFRPYQPPNLN